MSIIMALYLLITPYMIMRLGNVLTTQFSDSPIDQKGPQQESWDRAFSIVAPIQPTQDSLSSYIYNYLLSEDFP